MDLELQRYYEDRFEMFGTNGWKQLTEDVEKMLSDTNSLDGIADEKGLHFRKGEISIMRWILNLKEISEKAYEDLV